MLTNSMRISPAAAANAQAFSWQPTARKHGAAGQGAVCPSYLTSDVPARLLVRGTETRLEGALFGNRRDNQN